MLNAKTVVYMVASWWTVGHVLCETSQHYGSTLHESGGIIYNTAKIIVSDHFALLRLLIKRQLPRNFISILLDWFSKCYACVRWGGVYSYSFRIISGVRQLDKVGYCRPFYLPFTWIL